MADSLDIVTLNEGKAAINLATANTSYDTELAMFITAICRRVDALIGPVVVRTLTDEAHDGGGYCIRLRKHPVSSVTTVEEYDRAGNLTTLTAESADTKPADGYLLKNGTTHTADLFRRSSGAPIPFAVGEQNILVTYVAGRAANTAGADALYKLGVSNILRRVWQRESPVWAQTPDAFAAPDGGDVGFYRVVDPMVREWFAHENVGPAVA